MRGTKSPSDRVRRNGSFDRRRSYDRVESMAAEAMSSDEVMAFRVMGVSHSTVDVHRPRKKHRKDIRKQSTADLTPSHGGPTMHMRKEASDLT